MKKILFTVAAVLGFAAVSHAQEGFKVGANAALPIGDAGDLSTFSVGLDVAYLFEVSDAFYLGAATGFTNAFGEEVDFGFATVEVEDVQFVPVAAAARYYFADSFYGGADLGYAFGITEGMDGGFYYRPKVGYNFSDLVGVNVSYTGVSLEGGSWDTVGLGVEFSF